ncbi:hypothetical protein [Novosphingobium profundi]|uniref:hypothetical protein n=1 Tax=Novosphingobium profundi TaxID=1774954 RepID=UPI001CFD8800|nr:hypothetical protein [Novosphingobium profundi]
MPFRSMSTQVALTTLAATTLAACSPSGEAPEEATVTDSALDPIPAPSPASSADDTAAGIATPPPLNATPASAPPTPPPAASPPSGTSAREEGMTTKRIRFAPGTSSAIEEGSITGYDSVDYLLGVKAGQALNISLATKHTATYFNLLEPGESVVAIFAGASAGDQYEGVAQKSGDYRIRVFMMRSAARREETASYRLETIVN